MKTSFCRISGISSCIALLASCGGGGGDSGSVRPAVCDRIDINCGGLGQSTSATTPTSTPTSSSTGTSSTPAPSTAGPAPLPSDTLGTPPISIQFGTGNQVESYSVTLYKKDYAILISDASGNPVSGATVVVSVWPVTFRKGDYRWEQVGPGFNDGYWTFASPTYACANEDANRNGILDPGEDINNSGLLEPGVPITVNNSGTTDAAGIANISLIYPKDRAYWTDMELTIRGSVAGTESVSKNVLTLPALNADFTRRLTNPPGSPSPYGIGDCNAIR